MKNKTIKKIQFGGWNKRHFSEIREKVKKIVMDDEFEVIRKRRIDRKK